MLDNPKKQAHQAKNSSAQAQDHSNELEKLRQGLEELKQQMAQAQDKERRAIADYQNLLRRTQTDAARLAKFANKNLIADLVQPLEHLSMAAGQLQDKGLQMVIEQFWQVLESNGLREYNPVGEKFNVETMEAVEQDGEGDTVVQVLRPGYVLHDEVIQHAKVVVGK